MRLHFWFSFSQIGYHSIYIFHIAFILQEVDDKRKPEKSYSSWSLLLLRIRSGLKGTCSGSNKSHVKILYPIRRSNQQDNARLWDVANNIVFTCHIFWLQWKHSSRSLSSSIFLCVVAANDGSCLGEMSSWLLAKCVRKYLESLIVINGMIC